MFPYAKGQVWINHNSNGIDSGKLYITEANGADNSISFLSFGNNLRMGLVTRLKLEKGCKPPKYFGNVSILEKHRFTNDEAAVRELIGAQLKELKAKLLIDIKTNINSINSKLPQEMVIDVFAELSEYTENIRFALSQ